MTVDKLTGAELQAHLSDRLWKHHRPRTCPGCELDVMTVGIPSLAYTFEVCRCRTDDLEFDHLIERIWHVRCLNDWRPDEQQLRAALERIARVRPPKQGGGGLREARILAQDALDERAALP